MSINVLLIGDSISLDYSNYLKYMVKDSINLYGKPGVEKAYQNLDEPVGGNGGDSSMVLSYINELAKADSFNCDYFVFNCGLHDVKRDFKTGKTQIPIAEYAENINKIINLAKNKRIIFINSTPSQRDRYPNTFPFYRDNSDVVNYNKTASVIMKNNDIPIIDLYSFTCSLGLSGDDLFRDHTHFCENVMKLQASYIAGALNSMIE